MSAVGSRRSPRDAILGAITFSLSVLIFFNGFIGVFKRRPALWGQLGIVDTRMEALH